MPTPREKFQGLLKKLFQFDCAELDFGIYRIMNHKRAVIEQFIEKDLLDGVAMELTSGALAEESGLAQQLTEVAAQIKENFGDEALDAEGNLTAQYHQTPRGKQYLELQERTGKAKSRPELEAEIFNYLYSFFSRYYDEGDFMSLRRYSKRDKYAIPYNGEEVHLHWANSDQYYIKTGENFTDYSYKHSGWTVHFKLRNANVEQNNVKGAKRFFLPRAADAVLDPNDRTLSIPFEYRPLTAQEAITYKSKPQETILAEAASKIVGTAKSNTDALAALVHERRKDADGNPLSLLDHHLRAYTRKNTSDFFIHKDLKGFLERELDFYIKNEVLNLDELEAGGEARAESWFQLVRAIKGIGRKIIAFLAQIENFEKRLFEKKKFVTEVHYCVTLDRAPMELYSEIAKNKAQIEEWKRLFHIQDIKGDLATPKFKTPLNVKFLVAHQYLVLDTQFFSQGFQDTLLSSQEFVAAAKAGSVDEAINGVLVNSENFHALNLFGERYRGCAKCAYIDPPYNTGNDGFAYKDTYQHSTWITMMYDRLRSAMNFLARDSLLYVSIDRDEHWNLLPLLFQMFERENFVEDIVWQKSYGGGAKTTLINNLHEYVICFSKDRRSLPFLELPPDPGAVKYYKREDEKVTTRGKFRTQPLYSNSNDYRENLTYPLPRPSGLPASSKWNKEWKHIRALLASDKLQLRGSVGSWHFIVVDAKGRESPWAGELIDPPKQWQWEWLATRDAIINDELVVATDGQNWSVDYKQYRFDENGKERGKKPGSIRIGPYTQTGTKEIDDLFGFEAIKFPKPTGLIQELIGVDLGQSELAVIDFFAGSGTTGHAVVTLNREFGGMRRYFLVEIDKHFDTVLKPRLQKVIYSNDWKDGKPLSRHGSSHAFKYLRLESYEDALDNITFQTPDKQTTLQLEDYVLGYMLDFETKQSDTLLNVAKLDAPFDYKLRRHGKDEPLSVDLLETFNYLIGLHVASRRVYENRSTRYLVYRGRAEGRETVILWRTTRGWGEKEFEADKEFVKKHKLTEGAEDIFVNTDSFIPGARSLDPVFKRRMFNEE
jgi:adenine-specific DNA-methyltransferase